jgi:hemoglobin/transferrin/lactoferrin receptor protein
MDQESLRTAPAGAARADRARLAGAAALALTMLASAPHLASAQATSDPQDDTTTVYTVDPVIVTATRGPRAVSETPRPVLVFQPRDLEEQMPNTISDLFRLQPGVDVTGVGVSQVRPQIRGQGGQRILLLNDGLRMNNTRRQKDFGELPALVDVNAVDHVEVVRGPASVLYGSDAIGGVINILTKVPTREGFHGEASYLFGSAGEQSRVSGRVQGRSGGFSLITGGSWRTVGAYEAPSGSFGDITLTEDATVLHSGVEDSNFDARLGYDFNSVLGVFGKVEHYRSDDAGFGFVHPDDYQPGGEEIDITYPMQRFTKLTAGFTAQELGSALADRVSLTGYGQDNERDLIFDAVFPAGPGAFVSVDNHNYTDIRTYGFRAEARKMATPSVLLTYGFDGFQDEVTGTDNDTTTIVGFGPPMTFTDDQPSIPDAQLRSLGTFLQAEVELGERVSAVLGGRYTDVSAESFATPSLGNTPRSEHNNTIVGAANLMVDVGDGVTLIGSVGRGFRSPNLVEYFFEGVVPEGDAYQLAPENLKAETSVNVDLGARYQTTRLFAEAFVFRNKLYDGIRGRAVTDAAGDTVQTAGFNTYQDVNVDEIQIRGFEVNTDYRFPSGFELGASASYLDAKDAIDEDNPVGESYSGKLTGRLGYRDPGGRFWSQFEARHSAEQKDVAIPSGNALGDVLPAFTVLNLRGGVDLPEFGGFRQSITVSVNNLTNELYAETANASFFRPEPKRSVTVSLDVTF